MEPFGKVLDSDATKAPTVSTVTTESAAPVPVPTSNDAATQTAPDATGTNTNQQTAESAAAEEAAWKKEFDGFDKDKSGFIDQKDLQKMLPKFVSASMIAKAISYIDKNKDGKVSFDEYKLIRTQVGGAMGSIAKAMKKK
jgi:hypothetical protein